jgi:hypothetical protein
MFSTINSFVSRPVGRHPHGELKHRTLEQHSASENCVHFFRNAAVTAIYCVWTGQRMAGKDQQCVLGCVSVWSHERFTRNYQGVSHAKWLKANHASAPIRPGAVTQPVDVERRASRANEISTRAKNL